MKFSVLLSLDIELNGTPPREITEQLQSVIEQAVGEGRITGSTSAEMVEWISEINVQPSKSSICPHSGMLDDHYANVVHDETPIDRYCDAVEVHGVRDCGDGIVELDEEEPTMYSSYVHFKIGGVACVGDHSTRALAERYAQEVAACYGLLPLGK